MAILLRKVAIDLKALIDTVFGPVLSWLQSIYDSLRELSVPLSRPLNFDSYLGPIAMLGNGWVDFAETVFALAFIYGIAYIVVTQIELFRKFKDLIKWW